ncbi:MAG: protein phosphatase 2C domain-containing protein [Bacteroidetes bacterium]|nr:protein phosphatase 2C domain-containing protein [Bacteroidota bacterium]
MKKKKLFIPVIKNKKRNTKSEEILFEEKTDVANETIEPFSIDSEKLSIKKVEKNLAPVTEEKQEKKLPVEPNKQKPVTDSDKIISPSEEISSSQIEEKSIAPAVKTEEVIAPVKSFSNNFTSAEKNSWFVVSASSIGKTHVKSNIPCQDNHYCESIDSNWGIAICSDGAGSAENSQLGSKHVSNEIGVAFFKQLVIKNGWNKNNILPSQEEWSSAAREGFKQIFNSLEKSADEKKIKLNSLACTINVIIYSPIGLLVSHIGDGRAGYCNEKGEWKSLIKPHKGEEANQTIFITSDRWMSDLNFTMSGVSVPESNVVAEKPTAFTMMTDGCEFYAFECSNMDATTNKWNDPNLPYPKFFNPLAAHLKSMVQNNIAVRDANLKWEKFIEEGIEGLKNEPDDKTMILGILI